MSEATAHILVVDDMPDNAYLLCQILELSGYRTSSAAKGSEALAAIAKEPPDMVLLDVMMPEMDGYEVTRRIRADATLPFIPIILVTAKSATPDKLEGLGSGADDFLSKPVNRLELIARVRALLRLKHAQDALRAEQAKTELLYTLGRRLNASLDLDEVLGLALTLAGEALGATGGWVLALDEQGEPLRTIALGHPGGRPQPAHELLDGRLLAALSAPGADQMICDAAHSALAVALDHDGQRLGMLALFGTGLGALPPSGRELLAGVADQVSLALYNARLYTRLREAEAAREQMLYLLIHDMRTPLAGVISCLELISRSGLNLDADPELTGMALDACRLQDGMIGDLLDLHRAETGQLALDLHPTYLAATLAPSLPALGEKAQQKAIVLSAELPEQLLVLADGPKIVRVIDNLLRHAIKYTSRGGAVSVGASCDEHSGLVTVSVSDTGYPIDADALPRIFDRYYQPRAARHGARRGAGVSLPYCRAIVQLHSGRIWAESSAEQGTRIAFTLPLALDIEEEDLDEQMADFDR